MHALNTALLLCLLFSVSAPAQISPDLSTIKTEKGMMVLNNARAQPFSFLVPGSNPEGRQNDDGGLVISTDSGGVVVYFVKTSGFLDKKKTYSDVEILTTHRDQDIATQEKAWKTKLVGLEMGSSFVKVSNLSNELFPTRLVPTVTWLYATPKPSNTDRTFYQTMIVGDLILMLGTVFPADVNTDEVRAFVSRVLNSVTLLPPQKPAAARKSKPAKRPVKKN